MGVVARRGLAVGSLLAVVASGCAAPGFPDPHEETDCVAFTKEQQGDDPEGGISAAAVVPAGAPETVDVVAYWLGPEAFRRRAIFSVSEVVDAGEGDEAYYSTVYQEPRFGCSSAYLPGSDFAPDYWGPGNSLEVQNWRADSNVAKDDIGWFSSLGDRPRRVEIPTGETATILGFDGYRSGILVGETFVVIEATADKTATALRSLQRAGD